jgi:hypothetical protein
VLLNEVVSLDKDAMTGPDWERMQLQIALNESNCSSDQSHLSGLLNCSELVEITEDFNDDYELLTQDLNRALMRLEDLQSPDWIKAQPEGFVVTVEEEELKEFVAVLTHFTEQFQGQDRTEVFYLGGKDITVVIKGKNLQDFGLTLSKELTVSHTHASLPMQMEEAFMNSRDSYAYRGDTSCLEGVFSSLEGLKGQLLEQIEEAKAAKNSFTRIKRRQSRTSKENLENELERSRLHELTASPAPGPSRSKGASDKLDKASLEHELRRLEVISRCEKSDVKESARIAVRISRIKTELSRIRSEEVIQATKLTSLKGHKRSFTSFFEPLGNKNTPVKGQVSPLALSFTSFEDDSMGGHAVKPEVPSFSIEEISVDQSCSFYKHSSLGQQLTSLIKEREELEELRVKAKVDIAVQRSKLALEWNKLDQQRATTEAEVQLSIQRRPTPSKRNRSGVAGVSAEANALQRDTARFRGGLGHISRTDLTSSPYTSPIKVCMMLDPTRHLQIEVLCTEFLAEIEKLKT